MATPGNNEKVLQKVEVKGSAETKGDEGKFVGASRQIEDLATLLKSIAAAPGWEGESAVAASDAINSTASKLLTHAPTIAEVFTVVLSVKDAVSNARTAYQGLPPEFIQVQADPLPWEKPNPFSPSGGPLPWDKPNPFATKTVTNPTRETEAAAALSTLNAAMTTAIDSAADIQERLATDPIVDPSGTGPAPQTPIGRPPRTYNDDVEPYEWSHPSIEGINSSPGSSTPGGAPSSPGVGTYQPGPGSGSGSITGYPGNGPATGGPSVGPGWGGTGSGGGSNGSGQVSVDGGSTGTIPGVNGGGGGTISAGWPGSGSGSGSGPGGFGSTHAGGQSGLAGGIAGVGAVGGSALAGGAGLLAGRAGSGGLAGSVTGLAGGPGSASGTAGARGLSGGIGGANAGGPGAAGAAGAAGGGPRGAGGTGVPGVSGTGAGGSNAVMGGGGMGGGAGGAGGKSGRKRSSGGFVVPGLDEEQPTAALGSAARAGSRSQVVAPAVIDEDDSDSW